MIHLIPFEDDSIRDHSMIAFILGAGATRPCPVWFAEGAREPATASGTTDRTETGLGAAAQALHGPKTVDLSVAGLK